MYCVEHPHTQEKHGFPSTGSRTPPISVWQIQLCTAPWPALCSRHYTTKLEISRKKNRNLSTEVAHGCLKPVLAPSCSLPISGHHGESSGLGQGQKASSDQARITNALPTLLTIHQQGGYISFEPAGDLHIRHILMASTLS